MNHHISPAKTGLAVGGLVGGLHLLWAIFIALGWAQALVNFSLWAHMVNTKVVVQAFDPSTAVMLVVITAVVGYVIGSVFARIWNRVHRGR